MSGPFTTITVNQWQALQDALIAADSLAEQVERLKDPRLQAALELYTKRRIKCLSQTAI